MQGTDHTFQDTGSVPVSTPGAGELTISYASEPEQKGNVRCPLSLQPMATAQITSPPLRHLLPQGVAQQGAVNGKEHKRSPGGRSSLVS